MSSVRLPEQLPIPECFLKEKRLGKEECIAKYREWLGKTILSNYPDRCTAPEIDKVAEQVWQNYVVACEVLDNNHVVLGSSKRASKLFSEDLNRLYLDVYVVGSLAPRDDGCIACIGDKDALRALSQQDKDLVRITINLPSFYWSGFSEIKPEYAFISSNTCLIGYIGSSIYKTALLLIDFDADINRYSATQGNTALLLAVSKGWNHEDPDEAMSYLFSLFYPKIYPQREIIKALLNRKADVNAIHLANGMTALHLACLRGDDPEFIRLLLQSGAKPDVRDYEGRTPLELLDVSYVRTREIIQALTFSRDDGAKKYSGFGCKGFTENKSWTATLPTRLDRHKNQAEIRKILSCRNLPTFDGLN